MYILWVIAFFAAWSGAVAVCATELEENERKRKREVWEPTALEVALWSFEQRNGGPPVPKQIIIGDE